MTFTAFRVFGTTKPRRLIKKRLESHLLVSNSFTNTSDINNVSPLPTKAFAMGYLLWHRYCHCSEIKDLIPAVRSLCDYTREVVIYIVLIGKKCLKPNIWLETPDQKSTKSMMRTT